MIYTILYIEDESAIVELVHFILNHPEICLVSTHSAKDGLRIIRRSRPNLILLDVMIPDRDGWSIYHEIRNDAALKEIPIIMLTGQVYRYWVKKQFSNSKDDDYITKPFDVQSVRSSVEKMLGKRLWDSAPSRTGRAMRPTLRIA